ncbi:GntR family transcriptional regulator [Rhodococcus sp. GB-02]
MTTGMGGPVAEQVRRKILSDISSGILKPGDRLPSERELAEHFQVSRSTLRGVLTGLCQAGITHRLPGRAGGTFIAQRKFERDLDRVDGLPSYLARQGMTSGSQVLSAVLQNPEQSVRIRLGLDDEASLAFSIIRLRFADGTPLSIEQAWLPAQRFPGLLERPLGGSVYELLRSEYQVEVVSSEERLEVASATPEEARLLSVHTDAPLISIQRTARDAAGTIIECSNDLFRADRTQILVRSAGHGIRAESDNSDSGLELNLIY